LKLAVWRLASTFVISLLAGYITHFATIRGFIGNGILRIQNKEENQGIIRSVWDPIRSVFIRKQSTVQLIPVKTSGLSISCCGFSADLKKEDCKMSEIINDNGCTGKFSDRTEPEALWRKIAAETMKSVIMVTKFMGFAFLITALITFYVPENIISWIVRGNSTVQVVLATLIGIPMYTSNITALPMAGGLIDLGLNKGAALSFLIAGATTTLPAMVAVSGITKRRVFFMYLSFALLGALIAGLCFNLFS
jgi:uncharacterized membrane protein YraQ (UPF0718 family)